MKSTTSPVIVKRASAGLGLFASEDIPKATRIIEYKGKILTNAQADRKGGKYLFEINSKRTIDGSNRKNLARYVNHSCLPNSEAVLYKKGIWIKSLRKIRKGEELTYNYGKEYFNQFIKPYGCRCEKHRKIAR